MRFAVSFGAGRGARRLFDAARDIGMITICDEPGLLALAHPGTSSLRRGSALLIGKLFSGSNAPQLELPDLSTGFAEPGTLLRLLGRSWGQFALFAASGALAAVYRGPSGQVPVYRIGDRADAVFVSDAGVARALGLLDGRGVNFNFVVHWLQFPYLRTRATGIDGVHEVLPGALHARRSTNWSEDQGWTPSAFISREQAITDPQQAARAVREMALSTVPLQAGDGHLILELSGGLDSSIIAACLGQAGVDLACVNFATRSSDGDERSFARDAAAAFDLPLLELGEIALPSLSAPSKPGFRPGTNPLLAPFEEAIGSAIRDLGGGTLVDGGGGDNLFCSIGSAAPVIDALRWCGGRAALRTGRDVAIRANCTWWEVARSAAKRMKRRPVWKEDTSFLDPRALVERCELHPWLEDLRGAPPGKREHIEALVHVQHFLDRRNDGRQPVHPLLAQPLMELCLRIPTWLWVAGGRDRSIARNAFAGLVPDSVLKRGTKGSLLSLFHRSFGQLRSEIRELLMDGQLVSAGILDRERVAEAFRVDGPVADDLQLRLTEFTALELWLQSLATSAASSRPTGRIAPPCADRDRDSPESNI